MCVKNKYSMRAKAYADVSSTYMNGRGDYEVEHRHTHEHSPLETIAYEA
ncbi:hypothetical protein HYT24_00510 [Candidatus Pacearchaeota archaeon]|nr:hypothetical protein [Candidatus Pacearchaeota archaeon]